MDPIRVILGEDHALVRQGTRRMLEQYPDIAVVAEAEDGEQALDAIGRLRPDVAVLDVRMPKLSGIDVVRRMGKISPGTRALILTAYDDDDYVLALMDIGAAGYLLKTAKIGEVADAIRSVHAGKRALSPAIAVKLANLWHRRESSEMLTGRERQVLQLAARGLRNKAIASELSVSVRTVEGHFKGIFAKIGVSSRTAAVLYALAHGVATLTDPRAGEA